MKKKLIVVILLFSTLFSVMATGMPVIDVAAIAQAVQSAMTQVNQWNQQIKQWQSEYERIRKAAEKISSGDFTAVVTGLASLTNQMSGWTQNLGWASGTEWLESASDGSYSLLSLMSNSELFIKNLDTIGAQIQKNAEKLQSSENGWEAGSNAFSLTTNVGDLLTNGMRNFANIGLDSLEVYNSIAEMFNVSPQVMADIYNATLKKALEGAGFSTYNDLLSSIDETKSDLAKAQQELLDINASEAINEYNQKQAQVAMTQSKLSELQALQDTYLETEAKISQINAQQFKFESEAKKQKESEESLEAAKKKAEVTAQQQAEAVANFESIIEQMAAGENVSF